MRRFLPLCVALVLGAVPLPVQATTYVMMADTVLVDRAPAVARVVVDDVRPAEARAATLYDVTVRDSLKGELPSELTVSVPGGTTDEGMTWKIFGAPTFRRGDDAVLFLSPRSDGTWGIHQFLLGAFHETSVDGRRIALRDLSEATELGRAPGSRGERARDLEGFVRWIEDRAAGIHRPADYFVELPRKALEAAVDRFTLFEDGGTGLNFRWFDFDSGGSVPWRLNVNGTSLTPGIVREARTAWNSEPTTPINYTYEGATSSTGGLCDEGCFNTINEILGADPNGEMDGSFSCSSGGTLAIGGPWFDRAVTGSFDGQTFIVIQFGDIVFNDGVENCAHIDATALAEVTTHELGHTLGIGHSCGDDSSPSCSTSAKLDDATMRASAHFDGRGAVIREDDVAALRALYAESTPQLDIPAPPDDLTATTVDTTSVELAWNDESPNEDGFSIEMRDDGGAVGAAATTEFQEIDTVGSGAESYLAADLDPMTRYTFRVNAFNDSGASDYSNEATAITDAVPADCVEDAHTLCLTDDRFQVTMVWETKDDVTEGFAEELTADTGFFHVSDPNNVEVVVKNLNACVEPYNSFWVFIAGLTDQGVTITVIDTVSGEVRVYENDLGTPFALVRDTSAFETCDLL